MEKDWVKVYESTNTFAAELVHTVLNDHAFNPVLINKKDSSYLIGKQTAETFNAEEEANGKPGAIVPFPFRLKKIDPEKPMDFPEVQYALDKAELLVNNEINSKDSLDFLYDLLNDNPSIVKELQAHTDCRGGDDYNLKLSQRRAESCVNYLAVSYTHLTLPTNREV